MFQRELLRRKVEWFPGLELSSQELIARFVAEGFGFGLILLPPGEPAPPGTRVLALTDFPKVPYGALWMGSLSPLQQSVLGELQAIAATLPADK